MNFKKLAKIPAKDWGRLKMTDVVYVEKRNESVLVMPVGALDDMDKGWKDRKKKYKIYNVEVKSALKDVDEKKKEKVRKKEDARYDSAEWKWCANYNPDDLTAGEKMILAEIGEGPYANVED